MTQTQPQNIKLPYLHELIRYYQNFPKLVARLQEIADQLEQQHDARRKQFRAEADAYRPGGSSPEPDINAYSRDQHKITEAGQVATLAAIQEEGAPLYLSYQEAIRETGHAIYFDPHLSQHDYDAMSAKITQGQDGSLTLAVTTIYHFPPDKQEEMEHTMMHALQFNTHDTWVSAPMPADPAMAGGD